MVENPLDVVFIALNVIVWLLEGFESSVQVHIYSRAAEISQSAGSHRKCRSDDSWALDVFHSWKDKSVAH